MSIQYCSDRHNYCFRFISSALFICISSHCSSVRFRLISWTGFLPRFRAHHNAIYKAGNQYTGKIWEKIKQNGRHRDNNFIIFLKIRVGELDCWLF